MTPFLYKIAVIYYQQFGNELYRKTFVFPNRRAGLFFQKYLAEIAGMPLFSPSVITIQELFASLSPYRSADKIEMLVMLYNHFAGLSHSAESFDDFLYWGEMLLNDFNDVDKYMADASQLFRNVFDFRSMEDDLSHLGERQKEAIRRFWTHFMPVGDSVAKRKFHETWHILGPLYSAFRDELQKKGLAYEGMIFRDVAERAQKGALQLPAFDTDESLPGSPCYVFVGLNALTPSERVLLEQLKQTGIADFYWDYESPLVRDDKNRASLWVMDNLRQFPSKFPLFASYEDIYGQSSFKMKSGKGQAVAFGEDEDEHSVLFHSDEADVRSGLEKETADSLNGDLVKTEIELIGVPSGTGQAKQVTRIIEHLVETGAIPNPDEAINTAIVLPDERLLLPVLYSIPESVGKINVTMGYGLSFSSISSLVDHLAGLQRNMRMLDGEPAFYHRNVLSVISHPLIYSWNKEASDDLRESILAFNRVIVPQSEIPDNPVFKQIFRSLTEWSELFDYIKDILGAVYGKLTEEKRLRVEEGNATKSIDLEREFIVQYHKTVTRLQDRLKDARHLTLETAFRLVRKMSRSISVAFSGEPLSGLQVMGVLETRVIDFENLIILSMNEGVFPIKDPINSFIPFTLRKGFGLPVYEHRDSTYAYHFYRMISRAKKVFLIYDTRTEGMQTGEVSRYFYQLKYLYPNWFKLTERTASYEVKAPEVEPITVTKTPDVLDKLDVYREGGASYFSASLINNYINCPLQFYFSAVEGLSQENEISETIESDLFGSIYHKMMEMVYRRYQGKTVTPDVLTAIIKDDGLLTTLLERAFAECYFKQKNQPRPLVGQHYLIGEVLRRYVKQTLELDKHFTPFTFIAAEQRFATSHRVNNDLKVNFKGIIDRIDRLGESYRIVDYKTGTGSTDFKQMADLFNGSKANRPYQILQVFVYALFYGAEFPNRQLSPAIYYLRSIFGDPSTGVTCDRRPISDISAYMGEFLSYFHHCLEEIFDPTVPFTQTTDTKKCQWCAFKEICARS